MAAPDRFAPPRAPFVLATLLALALPAAARAQGDPYAPRRADDAPPSRGTARYAEQESRDANAAQLAAPSPTPRYVPDRLDRDDPNQALIEALRARGADRPEAEDQREELRDRLLARRPYQPSEFETFVSRLADKQVRRFGAELLVPAARGFTTPPTATVPTDYRLNPGDELLLRLAGPVEANDLRVTIDPEGQIFIPRVGAVTVGGVRYGALRGLIERRIARVYRGFQLDVTVARLRGITVYVTGFAATPGSYTVSSLSTLVNAVLAAGGPAAGGSFRSIQLRRGGALVSDFDLYDLLLKGDKSGDVTLQNGDVIYIAPAGAQVAVIGSANKEAVFEAAPGDTLSDILVYAGGVNTVAETWRLLLLDALRPTGGWDELPADSVATRKAARGMVLRVLSGVGLAKPLEQQPVLVSVSGEVARPGRYYVAPGTRLDQVIATAGGLTRDAYPFGGVFTRERLRLDQRRDFERAITDLETQLIATPITDASGIRSADPGQLAAIRQLVAQLRQREPEGRLVLALPPDAPALPGDVLVENNDAIYVPPRPVAVGVFGSVPGPASFGYERGQTIGDYVRRAGGVQRVGDRGNIFVVRANGSVLAPKRGLFSGSILSMPALPGDLIFVPVNGERGIFWARLRALTGLAFSGAVTAASVKTLAE